MARTKKDRNNKLADMDLSELLDELARHQAGGAEPALPQRDRPAREHRRDQQGPPADRPDQHLHPSARDRCRREHSETVTNMSEPPPTNDQRTTRLPKRRATRRKVPREGASASSCPTRWTRPSVVAVIERVRHPKYNKFVQRTKKLYAHDEANDVNVGDRSASWRPVRSARTSAGASSRSWSVHGDPAGIPPSGRRQLGRQGSARASRSSAAPAGATPRSATSSSRP
jgi:hypothetical protein